MVTRRCILRAGNAPRDHVWKQRRLGNGMHGRPGLDFEKPPASGTEHSGIYRNTLSSRLPSYCVADWSLAPPPVLALEVGVAVELVAQAP
jgi:hypothetical protein